MTTDTSEQGLERADLHRSGRPSVRPVVNGPAQAEQGPAAWVGSAAIRHDYNREHTVLISIQL